MEWLWNMTKVVTVKNVWSFASSRVHKFSECLFKIDTKRTYALDWCKHGQRQAKVYSSVLNVSGCIQKYPDVSKCCDGIWCIQMSPSVSESIQMYPMYENVIECVRMYLMYTDVSKYVWKWAEVLWCIWTYLDVFERIQTNVNVPGCIWMYPQCFECNHCIRMSLNVSWCTSSDWGGLVSLFWFGWCQLLR